MSDWRRPGDSRNARKRRRRHVRGWTPSAIELAAIVTQLFKGVMRDFIVPAAAEMALFHMTHFPGRELEGRWIDLMKALP